jgi:hypothetical protein
MKDGDSWVSYIIEKEQKLIVILVINISMGSCM